METAIQIVLGVILGLLLLAGLSLIGAIPLYFLWNWLMPTIFGLSSVTFFQSWGLVWLTGILFKSNCSSKTSD